MTRLENAAKFVDLLADEGEAWKLDVIQARKEQQYHIGDVLIAIC